MALKKFKPTTPGRRQMTVASFDEITTTTPEKSLLVALNKHAGRNSAGRITCRHRGGGAKRKYRLIDFKQTDKSGIKAVVKSIEYDPNRSAYIMLCVYKDGEKRYHLAPAGIEVGTEIVCAPKARVKVGNRMEINNVPVGYTVHNVELHEGKGGQMARTAGGGLKLVSLEGEYAQIQMASGEVRLISKKCYATIGQIGNIEHNNITIGKAGRMRHKGRRPQVRGKVMNPVDHPHGGGEGSTSIGLKYPKTPWGMPALGFKTRRRKDTTKWIVKDRRRK